MALKIMRREEATFFIKEVENEHERSQLARIYKEVGMRHVLREPCRTECAELIAVDKESKKVIGGSVALMENHKNAEILLVVSFKHRRKGVGTGLLHETEERLRELGVEKASLLPLNKGAHEFLVKNGYHYVGDVEQRVGGQFVVAYMEKRLAP